MTTRPSMHARDSSGRNVSLLNDDHGHAHSDSHSDSHSHAYYHTGAAASFRPLATAASPYHHPFSTKNSASRPPTPPSSNEGSPPLSAMIRADSMDSENTSEMSPITPSESGRQLAFPNALPKHEDQTPFGYTERAHPYPEFALPPYETPFYEGRMAGARTHVYDEAVYPTGNPDPPERERAAKRFNCRYRENLGCGKTFTTSGHASRHSKIHTAEKAVPCTHEGCQKKFTRNDNMKQHLETHAKDRSRSSMASKAGGKSPARIHAGLRRGGRAISHPPVRTPPSASLPPIDPALLSPVETYHRAFDSNSYSFQVSIQPALLDTANTSPTSASEGFDALSAAIDLSSQLPR